VLDKINLSTGCFAANEVILMILPHFSCFI
jgi:hypothetical protein